MSLIVNLRHLEAHPAELTGELSMADLDLDLRDEIVRAEKPLLYELEVQQLENALLLQGRLRLVLLCECVRCLKPFECPLEINPWTRYLPLDGEEKAVVVSDCVDLTPYVREDILLEIPQHPLCKAECCGLPKPDSGKAKRSGGARQTKAQASAWAELDNLKL
jgi:uncharacterized protein